jgi:hypothetical protein
VPKLSAKDLGLDGTAAPHMLTQGDIGRLLRPFAIRSKTLWPPGRNQRADIPVSNSRRHGLLLRTKRHTATGKQIQVLVAAVNHHMPATPSRCAGRAGWLPMATSSLPTVMSSLVARWRRIEQYEDPATASHLEAFAKLEAGDPRAIPSLAAHVGNRADDQLASFHLRRLLNGATVDGSP